jgi:hypothetical protein
MKTEVMIAMTVEEDALMVHEEEVATDAVIEAVTIVVEGIGGAKREAKNY